MRRAVTTRPAPAPTITSMTDREVYLEKLAAFSRLLREEGMNVSLNETADACRILAELGMEDREVVKSALCTVFAKSREEQLRFSRVFDSFFLSEDAIRALGKKHAEQERENARAREEAEEELRRFDNDRPFTDDQKEAYALLPEAEKERLRKLREKYIGDDSRNPELYGSFIHSVFARSILEQQMLMEDAALGGAAADPELGMLYRDLTDFKDSEIPKAVEYIQTIARQISGELDRKHNARAHERRIDFRPTIRRALETGGRFYRLVYRKKRSHRKELVILCDVSASMIQFSEFVLRFIRSLDQAADSSRVFLFSEELCEADPFRLQNMDRFREYVRQSGIYGKGTALGRALHELNEMRPAVFTASTMLLIVSDAKTTDEALAASELLRARRSCGEVCWLNPIPERKWHRIRSVQTMLQFCPMLPCSTLRELGAACRKLVC